MIITTKWFSDRKWITVNKYFQQLDLGLRWNSTPWVSRPAQTNPRPGADSSISLSGLNYEIQGTSNLPDAVPSPECYMQRHTHLSNTSTFCLGRQPNRGELRLHYAATTVQHTEVLLRFQWTHFPTTRTTCTIHNTLES